MLDVRRLRLLRELARRGTIAAVAEALAFSPSAVSQQLGVLEREAGLPLLERTGRRVRLTRTSSGTPRPSWNGWSGPRPISPKRARGSSAPCASAPSPPPPGPSSRPP
ncbi:helix-turn-helix domain-containing protein [Streptomyces goshikiensis]|uniref:helix-turn-helix domain-containing protein n=1 Tax=Streptomyces goshikiensis TaxID=1942 RepID=UPI003718B465